MPIRDKQPEIRRLLASFETEAAKFHKIQLCLFSIALDHLSSERKFSDPNHAVMLWQYFGTVDPNEDERRVLAAFEQSNLQWGLRGAELSSFAVIEGVTCDLFVRMAMRAGSLFDKGEAQKISSRVVSEIIRREQVNHPKTKPLAVTNNNPLAIWLNYLLHHLSLTNPGRDRVHKIEPALYSLSLLALERLAANLTIDEPSRPISRVSEIPFKVAMSFPGEKRSFVAEVVDHLRPSLGPDTIFYDYDYQAQLARPNLDTLLQKIYTRSHLLVIFLSREYAKKEWCGLEWRAIRDIIKSRQDERVMFVRFDDAPVDGIFSLDGYIDGTTVPPHVVARYIIERLTTLLGSSFSV